MFDFVANHASIDNPIVQGALISRHLPENDERYRNFSKYKDFVITYSDNNKPSNKQLKELARPRPNPVLTRYTVYEDLSGKLFAELGNIRKGRFLGKGYVWTTFSRSKRADGTEDTRQVDLNFANPLVLVESINILLF